MYHKDKNIIFIHITKSAGGSVQQAFKRDDFYFDLAEDHKTAQQLLEILDRNVFDQCFKFSFVRNPWVRMVSIYFYYYKYHASLDFCPEVQIDNIRTRSSSSNSYLESTFDETVPIWNLSFKKWLKAFCLDSEASQSGHPIIGAASKTNSNLNIKNFHLNQLNWLVSSNQGIFGDDLLVDYIGRVENIQSDMDHICNKIGIKKMDLSSIGNANPVLQPKVYKNDINQISKFVPSAMIKTIPAAPYSSFYDAESIEIVRNLCKKDIDFFQYEYDLEK